MNKYMGIISSRRIGNVVVVIEIKENINGRCAVITMLGNGVKHGELICVPACNKEQVWEKFGMQLLTVYGGEETSRHYLTLSSGVSSQPLG